ncbi:MAG: hypothetical protein Tsb0013_09920 [Phycisphaerales bacterium]
MTPAWLALVVLTSGAGGAPETVSFEAPVEIKCGDRTFVQTVYPSPAVFDLDKDGIDELFIGDLFGFIQTAERDGAGWGKATKMKDKGGNDLKFDNW